MVCFLFHKETAASIVGAAVDYQYIVLFDFLKFFGRFANLIAILFEILCQAYLAYVNIRAAFRASVRLGIFS